MSKIVPTTFIRDDPATWRPRKRWWQLRRKPPEAHLLLVTVGAPGRPVQVPEGWTLYAVDWPPNPDEWRP